MPGMTERKRYMREETTARGDYEAVPHKYITGGKVNSVYGLENIIVSWDNDDDGKPTCLIPNYANINFKLIYFIH